MRMAPWSVKINLSETNVLTPGIQDSKDTVNRKEQAKRNIYK